MNILAVGQSNMRGGAGAQDGPRLNTIDARVLVWNNTQDNGPDGTAFISPPIQGNVPWGTGSLSGANNLAGWFCHRAAQELQEGIKLVLVAKGGSAVSLWDPDTGVNYQHVDSAYTASGQPPADLLLWHQGEGDHSNTKANYKAELEDVIAAFRSDGFLAANAPVIFGGLIYAPAAHIDEALQEMAAANPIYYYASASGMHDVGDGTHFTGACLYHMGYFRYWEQYRSHIGFERTSGPL